MELFSSNVEKFQETETPKKNSLYFRKWNFLALVLNKKILICSQKKVFLIFPEMNPALFTPRKISYTSGNGNPEKASFIFSKESFYYILGNGNHEKLFYISERNFPCSKNEKDLLLKSFLFFKEMDFSSHKLKRTSYISETNLQGLKIINLFFKYKRTRKNLLILFFIKKQNFLN